MVRLPQSCPVVLCVYHYIQSILAWPQRGNGYNHWQIGPTLGGLGLGNDSAIESGLDAGLAAGEIIYPFITQRSGMARANLGLEWSRHQGVLSVQFLLGMLLGSDIQAADVTGGCVLWERMMLDDMTSHGGACQFQEDTKSRSRQSSGLQTEPSYWLWWWR